MKPGFDNNDLNGCMVSLVLIVLFSSAIGWCSYQITKSATRAAMQEAKGK